MQMRLPESGSPLASVLSGLGHAVTDGEGIAVEQVSEAQLVEAVAAMVAGDIEYLILEDGEAFLQAAGGGAGTFALQFSPGGGDGLREVPGGVTEAAMRTVLLAYRRGDPAWRGEFPWSPM
jgi:hypothetical protein